MTLIHTPRVIASIVKGLRQKLPKHNTVGFLTPHNHYGRVGLFDVDYLGHMNNAAYLSRAEYARWEWTASNGWLNLMYQTNTSFVISNVTCRYRAEIRPLFKRFQVQTSVSGMDDKSVYLYQTFRYPNEGNDRLRAQVMLKTAIVQKGKVVSPREFMIQDVGFDPEFVDQFQRSTTETDDDNVIMEEMMSMSEALEECMKKEAAEDDKRRTIK